MKSEYPSLWKFFLLSVFIFAVSLGTAAAQPRGRLIVWRAPDFGRNWILNLRIDDRTVANLGQGQRFDHFVWTGRRVLTVHARRTFNASRSTSTTLNVRPGRTYVFTALWRGANNVVLVPGRQ